MDKTIPESLIRITMKIHPSQIAFDFDGVVADTFRLFVRLACSEYGIDIKYESITDYEFLNVVKMDRALAEKLIEILTDIPHELDLRPNTGALEILTRLSAFAPVLVVTARPYGRPVEKWFEKHLPHLKNLISVEATGENTTKLPFLQKKNIKYFVDDRLDTCMQLAGDGITPIVYDQPWNRSSHDFKVVADWHDIAGLIDWEY
jgi:5'(3')-deoxyribonucleotidase